MDQDDAVTALAARSAELVRWLPELTHLFPRDRVQALADRVHHAIHGVFATAAESTRAALEANDRVVSTALYWQRTFVLERETGVRGGSAQVEALLQGAITSWTHTLKTSLRQFHRAERSVQDEAAYEEFFVAVRGLSALDEACAGVFAVPNLDGILAQVGEINERIAARLSHLVDGVDMSELMLYLHTEVHLRRVVAHAAAAGPAVQSALCLHQCREAVSELDALLTERLTLVVDTLRSDASWIDTECAGIASFLELCEIHLAYENDDALAQTFDAAYTSYEAALREWVHRSGAAVERLLASLREFDASAVDRLVSILASMDRRLAARPLLSFATAERAPLTGTVPVSGCAISCGCARR
jgi:hypothetical protein